MQATNRGGVFGQGIRLSSKNLGMKPIPGQGMTPEKIDPNLSRQQRRLAARRAADPSKRGKA